MRFPSLPELIQPFQLGGLRIQPGFLYTKTWKSRKNLTVFADFSYGVRNKDLNGNIRLNRMYNPCNRGFYEVVLQKDFAERVFNQTLLCKVLDIGLVCRSFTNKFCRSFC